ncbi:hypothetical protein FB45DRAFT_868329 [Roridomyces roridus]|uniref:Uncharacterized protein n=1 Tax=Roridomyces roridus TaxID=1738132 RepID=A0AAD7BQ18_9AGAR|nr:hypothetical protein FB45DRAFT_868329 [Roridomyces roridus]
MTLAPYSLSLGSTDAVNLVVTSSAVFPSSAVSSTSTSITPEATSNNGTSANDTGGTHKTSAVSTSALLGVIVSTLALVAFIVFGSISLYVYRSRRAVANGRGRSVYPFGGPESAKQAEEDEENKLAMKISSFSVDLDDDEPVLPALLSSQPTPPALNTGTLPHDPALGASRRQAYLDAQLQQLAISTAPEEDVSVTFSPLSSIPPSEQTLPNPHPDPGPSSYSVPSESTGITAGALSPLSASPSPVQSQSQSSAALANRRASTPACLCEARLSLKERLKHSVSRASPSPVPEPLDTEVRFIIGERDSESDSDGSEFEGDITYIPGEADITITGLVGSLPPQSSTLPSAPSVPYLLSACTLKSFISEHSTSASESVGTLGDMSDALEAVFASKKWTSLVNLEGAAVREEMRRVEGQHQENLR